MDGAQANTNTLQQAVQTPADFCAYPQAGEMDVRQLGLSGDRSL